MRQKSNTGSKNSENKEKKNNENIKETTVSISFPNEIATELVQANELRHYEIFNVLAGLFSSSAVGFWTASVGQNDPILKWIGGVFTFFTIIFVAVAIYYRKKVFHGSIKKVSKISDFK